MVIDSKDAEDLMRQLDGPCWQCGGSGKYPVSDCDICYGTGYQPTQAGVELLNFLYRQRRRTEQEMV